MVSVIFLLTCQTDYDSNQTFFTNEIVIRSKHEVDIETMNYDVGIFFIG